MKFNPIYTPTWEGLFLIDFLHRYRGLFIFLNVPHAPFQTFGLSFYVGLIHFYRFRVKNRIFFTYPVVKDYFQV